MTKNFANELNALIAKHLARARYGDDFLPIAIALHAAADRIDEQADQFPWRDELEQEFRERGRPC
jgi:hypothetical protein